jgi:hypothetical protein
MSPDKSCAVCSRTILSGERTRVYMSSKNGSQLVCELCRGRAEALGWVDPAARGARTDRAQPVEDSPQSRFEQAVSRFNQSEAARTVAGLMRTLGEPWVSVGAAAGSPTEVRVTVAWELTWYQWGIDLADQLRAVFPIDAGKEIQQLDQAARQWNATAALGGQLRLGGPAKPRRDDGERVA